MSNAPEAMNKPLGRPFIDAARAQTMRRDFDKLRQAIRAWDAESSEQAFESCERWIDQLRPTTRKGE